LGLTYQPLDRLSIGGGFETSGSYNIDVIHRQVSLLLVPSRYHLRFKQLLDKLLLKPQWAAHASAWTEQDKRELTFAWHRLSGMVPKTFFPIYIYLFLPGWPDSVQWLNELKKDKIIVSLSNGNMSLLIDMVRFLLSNNAVTDECALLGEACKFALGRSVLY